MAACIASVRTHGEATIELRCVIVDDSEEFAASVSRLLSSQGLEIVGSAVSGDEAVRLVERLAPDIALVDIELGEDDGLALSYRLAARTPSTRVILISSYGPDDVGDLIQRSPAAGFLPKTELGAAAIARLLA
jgi:two-component system, NarL family, nitrate/nitrite response regulator NarL